MKVEPGRWLVALAMGLLVLSTAACIGSSRNFSTSAEAASSPGGDVGRRIGNLAPDFVLKDLDGNMVRLSELRGKPVMVNFWATWCPPCKEEMPAMEKAYQKYAGQIVFLGVDLKESEDTVRQFTRQNGYSWTFLLDTNAQAASAYKVTGVPETFFIDREGIIRDLQIGPLSASGLESKLGKILK